MPWKRLTIAKAMVRGSRSGLTIPRRCCSANPVGYIPGVHPQVIRETLCNLRIPGDHGKQLKKKSVLFCSIFQVEIENSNPGINRRSSKVHRHHYLADLLGEGF